MAVFRGHDPSLEAVFAVYVLNCGLLVVDEVVENDAEVCF